MLSSKLVGEEEGEEALLYRVLDQRLPPLCLLRASAAAVSRHEPSDVGPLLGEQN